MRKYLLTAVTMAVTAFLLPNPARSQDRGDHRQEGREHGDEARRPEYHFKPENRATLREHYKELGRVDANHREHFVAGANLPGDWRHHIRPVPRAVLGELPAIPAGYLVGYYDGYAVVYDPRTGYILETLDLY